MCNVKTKIYFAIREGDHCLYWDEFDVWDFWELHCKIDNQKDERIATQG